MLFRGANPWLKTTPTDEVMPVNVAPTREMAEALSIRLKTLAEQILPHFPRLNLGSPRLARPCLRAEKKHL